MSPGDLIDEAELEARGYSVAGLVEAGEAEVVSSASNAAVVPALPKKRGRKPAVEKD